MRGRKQHSDVVEILAWVFNTGPVNQDAASLRAWSDAVAASNGARCGIVEVEMNSQTERGGTETTGRTGICWLGHE